MDSWEIDIKLIDRILDKVRVDSNGCWIWTASLNKNGYSQTSWKGKTRRAHRLLYEQLNGPIPQGLHCDHLCRVRACVNPEHIEPVTPMRNARRGDAGKNNRDKTHCPAGHPYDEQNTIRIRQIGKGWSRMCSTCLTKKQAEYARRYRAKKRAARSPES